VSIQEQESGPVAEELIRPEWQDRQVYISSDALEQQQLPQRQKSSAKRMKYQKSRLNDR